MAAQNRSCILAGLFLVTGLGLFLLLLLGRLLLLLLLFHLFREDGDEELLIAIGLLLIL